MRRPRDHRTRVGRERTAHTRNRILAAALGVFADLGPDAPKIDDFVRVAGISRGTFYNHFESVDALLNATSAWTTRTTIESIEAALDGLEDPVLRFGVGHRLFFARAQSDPVWCRFVARVWKVAGNELPLRDIGAGLRTGVFRAPSATVAHDLVLGAIRQALLHIGSGTARRDYGAQMTVLLLQTLGTDARRIAAAMQHALPSITSLERLT
jgi:AcrR family transcriptional regulator